MKGFQYTISIFTFVNQIFSDLASQPFFFVLYMFQQFVHVTFPTSLLSQILYFAVFYEFQDFVLGHIFNKLFVTNSLFCHLQILWFLKNFKGREQ